MCLCICMCVSVVRARTRKQIHTHLLIQSFARERVQARVQQQCWSFSIFTSKQRTNQLESHPISSFDTHKIRSIAKYTIQKKRHPKKRN